MLFRNDGRGEIGDNEPYDLLILEKEELEEARSFASKYRSKIAEDKKKFADKSALGLWWDAKGLFKCSDVNYVIGRMKEYESFYKEIDILSENVENGDTSGYKRLRDIYKELQRMEKDSHRDVTYKKSSAACKMSREFLEQKHKLSHNLKKVECVVLNQKLSKVEKSLTTVSQMMEEIRRESDEKLKQVLKEAEERAEARILEMKEENEKLILEAEKNRLESDEKLKQAVEEANRRSEARMQEMAEQNRAALQKMAKLLENLNSP